MLNKNDYKILINNIPKTILVSETSQNWYDSNNQLFAWSGSIYYGPNINDVYYNTGGTLSEGYYNWNGTKWVNIDKEDTYFSYNIPVYLESHTDEFGVMVGFDGNIEQIEQIVNFTYKQSNNTVTVYNTVNPDKLRLIVQQTYTVNWGDGHTSQIDVNSGKSNTNLPSVSHTYLVNSGYTITISLQSPWSNEKLSKNTSTW
jgi:phage tail sheath protein FI